jgi:hypothetical protein
VTDPHALQVLLVQFRLSYYMIDYTMGYGGFPKKAFKSVVWIFDRYDYLDPKRAELILIGF